MFLQYSENCCNIDPLKSVAKLLSNNCCQHLPSASRTPALKLLQYKSPLLWKCCKTNLAKNITNSKHQHHQHHQQCQHQHYQHHHFDNCPHHGHERNQYLQNICNYINSKPIWVPSLALFAQRPELAPAKRVQALVHNQHDWSMPQHHQPVAISIIFTIL